MNMEASVSRELNVPYFKMAKKIAIFPPLGNFVAPPIFAQFTSSRLEYRPLGLRGLPFQLTSYLVETVELFVP